jgi:chain length determinant protein tyrosine kinase EpsG
MKAQRKILPLEAAPYPVVRNDLRIGTLLAAQGKLDRAAIEQVVKFQQARGLRFGEAALRLHLITPEDLRAALAKQYDYPYLPLNDDGFGADLAASRDARHPQAEQLRALRTQLLIRWNQLGREPRALAIVSPGSGEGRSYVSANLAVLFAQLGLRTLLIDADMRAPRQFEIFNIPDRIGLSAVLSGRASREAAVPVPAFGPLAVLPAGARPPNPQELLLRPALGAFLDLANSEYDVILLDTPPARDNADAQSVAFSAGSVLVLARTNQTRQDDAAGLVRELGDAGAVVVGTVLNSF